MADKVLRVATNEDIVASISIEADLPVSLHKVGCAAMDAKLVADKQIGRDDIMEEHNVTKSIHQRLAEPFKLQQEGGDFEGAIPALVKVESMPQGIAIDSPIYMSTCADTDAATGPEFMSTCAVMDAATGPEFMSTCAATAPEFMSTCAVMDAATGPEFMSTCAATGPGPEFMSTCAVMDAATGPKFRLTCAATGPEFMSKTQNDSDDTMEEQNVINSMHQRLAKQTNGDEDSSILRLYQQLYGYATQGKIDSFMDTIERKLEGNARDRLLSRRSPHNNTLLHIAAKFGHAKLAAKILNLHKPLLFQKNDDKDTALHIAAKAGDLDTTNTILHIAGKPGNNNKDLVFKLLSSKNNEWNTPLHEALIHGYQSVAKCLIEAHRFIHFNCNTEGKSSLYLAAEEGFAEIVKLMQEKASEENIPVSGKSPLHGAILGRGNKELLEIISSMEETFRSPKDEKDRTPLHCAASIGYLEGVRFLLERRLSDSHQGDHRGNFPIHLASSKGHVKIVKELLRHRPDSKEFRNFNYENILHVAARCGKDNVVKYFLQNGEFQMLINQKDSNGNTPLHLATKHHRPKVVYRLAWDTRTNLKLLNGEGMTALDITERTLSTIDSYRGSLTWTILKSAFAQPAQSLHVLQWWRSPQVADNGRDDHEERFKDKVNTQSLHVQSRKQRSPQEADNGGDHHEESFKDRVNALLVVATLVATVAFAAGFTMPGGNNDSAPHEGMAILLTKAMFQIFVICNTIAMYTAILVAVSLIWAQLGDVNLVYVALRLALPLLGIALTMMSLAFMAGVYVVVSNLHWLAYVVLILGFLFIVTVIVVFAPLSCKTTSRFYILRCITYLFFCVEVWASGSHKKDQKED